MRCDQCGTEIPSGAAFCPGCGKRLAGGAKDTSATPAATAPAPSTPQQLQQKAEQVRAARDVPEQELWRGAYAYKSMLGMLSLGGIATLVGIIVIVAAEAHFVKWFVFGSLVVMWIVIGAIILQRRLGIRYRLTNQRFFIQKGIIGRVIDRIEVIDIDDMEFEQSPFERMFDVGSIRLCTTDRSVPKFTLQGIEHVQEVFNLIDQARRAERNRRGLYVESS
jgi:membrane protein YdbS with pleckstrin-like domain